MFGNNKKNDLKYYREGLYKCRDLEISNLWQRSVFLSVFLVLCFSGYGYLIIQIINLKTEEILQLPYLHLTAIILGVVSLIFSTIWIMMAKGSKAWYEVYEKAISKFEYTHFKELGLPYENIMGEMKLKKKKKNNFIFSTSAGGYSVSRINIAIGQICFILWSIAILNHIVFNLICLFTVDCNSENHKIILLIIATLLIPIIGIFSIFILHCSKWIKSSCL